MKVARVNARRLPILTGTGGLGGVDQWPSSTSLPWYNVVTDGGAVGDGVTDDTVAIQDSIDTATAGGTCSAVLFFPPGVYLIGGALQDTGAFNGQLLLPNVGHSDPHIVIEFRGAVRPGLHPVYGTTWDDGCFSVIKSSLTGASGTASVISGSNDVGSPSAGHGNNLEVFISDLVCVGVDNPTFTFWNLSACQGGGCDVLQISTPGAFAGTPTQPTHSNAYGIKWPQIYFSNTTAIGVLSVGGFYTGVLAGELDEYDSLILGPLINGIEFPAVFYPTLIKRMQPTATQNVMVGTGTHGVDVLQYVAEHSTSPAWAVTVYDVNDASNFLSGEVRWFNAATGGTPDHSFILNGGTGLWTWETLKLAPPSGVTPGSYTNTDITVDVYGRVTAASNGSGTATTIWVPVMTEVDTDVWYVSVTGDGDAIMTEVPL